MPFLHILSCRHGPFKMRKSNCCTPVKTFQNETAKTAAFLLQICNFPSALDNHRKYKINPICLFFHILKSIKFTEISNFHIVFK